MRKTPTTAAISARPVATGPWPPARVARGVLAAGLLLMAPPLPVHAEADWRAVASSGTVSRALLAQADARPLADSRALVAQKLRLLETLLGSAAARKIEDSMNPTAKMLLAETGEQLIQARAGLAADDLVAAATALDSGLRKISQATALLDKAAPRRSPAEERARYQRVRRQTEAYVRVLASQAPAGVPGAAATPALARLDALLGQAAELAAADRLVEANRRLGEAYRLAVDAVAEARAGQTVVSSLDFETPEQELDYERRRNASYEILVGVMLDQAEDPARLRGLADRYVAESQDLRERAEVLARGGDHPAAIDTMEAATRKLIFMLRAGGLAVPE